MHFGRRGVPETHTADRDAQTLAGRHDRHGGGGKETRRVDAGPRPLYGAIGGGTDGECARSRSQALTPHRWCHTAAPLSTGTVGQWHGVSQRKADDLDGLSAEARLPRPWSAPEACPAQALLQCPLSGDTH